MSTTQSIPQTLLSHRDELIRDIRALADWLEQHPEAPVGEHASVQVQYSVDQQSDAAKAHEVRRVAGLLGLNVDVDANSITACLRLTGRTRYVVHATTRGGGRRWDNAMSAMRMATERESAAELATAAAILAPDAVPGGAA